MINLTELKQDVDQKMQKIIAHYILTLSKIRTGRAHPGILDTVMVDYYGSLMPLSQVANVMASDARTLTIQAWESKMTAVIEKAIRDSDLGLNPMPQSGVIRVNMPQLTEERRKELIKLVKSEAEGSKISIRNVRRDINNYLKNELKAKNITEDDDKKAQLEAQKLTDKFILEIDKLTAEKEKELLVV